MTGVQTCALPICYIVDTRAGLITALECDDDVKVGEAVFVSWQKKEEFSGS